MKHNHTFSRLAKALLLTGIIGAMVVAFLFAPASATAIPKAMPRTQSHQAGTFIHLASEYRSPATSASCS